MPKRYTNYDPRVLLYIDEIAELSDDTRCVFLSEKHLYIIKNLIQYAHRFSNWVKELLDDGSYWGPDEKSDFLPIVLDLEEAIMTDANSILQEISDKLDALECICQSTLDDRLGVGNAGDYFDDGTLEPRATAPPIDAPASSTDVCKLSEASVAMFKEICTEWVIPLVNSGVGELVPLLCALIAGMVSGAAAIPVYIITEIVQEMIELGFEMASENFLNWVLSVEDDMICVLYNAMKDDGTTQDGSDAIGIYLDDDDTLGSVQRQVLKMIFNTWLINAARAAQVANTSWYQANTGEYDCTECPLPAGCVSVLPCVEGDWVAGIPPACNGGVPLIDGGTLYSRTALEFDWETGYTYVRVKAYVYCDDGPYAVRFGFRDVASGVTYHDTFTGLAAGGNWIEYTRQNPGGSGTFGWWFQQQAYAPHVQVLCVEFYN